MPVADRTRSRVGWLWINVLPNLLAVAVLSVHDDALASLVAVVVFLPLVSDMGACAGNQAAAVTLREMGRHTTGPLRSLAVVAGAWKGDPWLGLSVGLAVATVTPVAAVVVGTLPLGLRRLGIDPAATGALLTSVTDVVGFTLLVNLALALAA